MWGGKGRIQSLALSWGYLGHKSGEAALLFSLTPHRKTLPVMFSLYHYVPAGAEIPLFLPGSPL